MGAANETGKVRHLRMAGRARGGLDVAGTLAENTCHSSALLLELVLSQGCTRRLNKKDII